MHGYVYTLIDPRTNEVRYVGQSIKKNPEDRLSAHLSPSSLKRHSYLYRWLTGLVAEGKRPKIVAIAYSENQAALDASEIWHIRTGREIGLRLVNQADGGGGRAGYVPSEEERRKISEAQIGVPKPKHTEAQKQHMRTIMSGRLSPNTSEHHARLNEAKRGVPRSQETKDKISKTKTGSKLSDETRARMREAHLGKSAHPNSIHRGTSHGMFRKDISTDEIVRRVKAGERITHIARSLNQTRTFVYRRLAQATQAGV